MSVSREEQRAPTAIELINLCPGGQPSLMERLLAREQRLSTSDTPPATASYVAGQRAAWHEARQVVANWAAALEMRR